MKINSIYPVICTNKIKESREFYITHFGFEVSFDADWYVSLKSSGNPTFELAILDYTHPSVPEGFRHKTSGIIINMEVPNADKEYKRLVKQGLSLVQDIRSEDFGQRHFITKDPNNILIDIIQNIQPSEEFLAQYA